MSTPENEAVPTINVGQLMHYGEIMLEIDQTAAKLADMLPHTERSLPTLRFRVHGHHYQIKNWVMERLD